MSQAKKKWSSKIWQIASSRALTLYLLGLFGFYYLLVVVLTGREVATVTLGIDLWVGRGGDVPELLAKTAYAKLFVFALIFNFAARLFRKIGERTAKLDQRFTASITLDMIFRQPIHTVMNFSPKRTRTTKTKSVNQLLSSRGYKISSIEGEKTWCLHGSRGQFSFWSNFLFKLGLLFILAGLIVSMMSRVAGSAVIGEGQVIDARQVDPEPLRYSWLITEEQRKGASLSHFPWLGLKANYVEPALNSDFLPESKSWFFAHDFTAEFILFAAEDPAAQDVREISVQVGIYPPSYLSGYYLFLYMFGIGPEIIVQDLSGRNIYQSSLFLDIYPIGQEDFFEIPELPYDFSLKIVKGPVSVNGKKLVSRDVYKPTYYLKIFEGKKKVFEQLVETGGSTSFKDFSIIIPKTGFWVGLGIVRDWGLPLAIFGCYLSLLGFLLWFFFKLFVVREELFFVLEREGKYNRLYLGLKTEWSKRWWRRRKFQQLTRELDELLGGEIEQDI